MEYRKEHRFDGVEISLALFLDLSREGSSAFLVDDLDLEEFWNNAVHFFPKDDNLGIYVENARRERGRASEGGEGCVPESICYTRS